MSRFIQQLPDMDFESILPCPAELDEQDFVIAGTEMALFVLGYRTGIYKDLSPLDCPWCIQDNVKTIEQLREWLERRHPGAMVQARKRMEYVSRYGASDRMEWCEGNWGASRNAEFVGDWVKTGEGEAEIKFETAWTPASPRFWKKASALFPALSLTHKFASQGGAFLGYQVFEAGKTIKRVTLRWDSAAGVALRDEVGEIEADKPV